MERIVIKPRTTPVSPILSQDSPPPFGVRSFGLSDRGKVRPTNEDGFVIAELARTLSVHQTNLPQSKARYSSHRGHILLVADGMGGHRAGEVVSVCPKKDRDDNLLNF